MAGSLQLGGQCPLCRETGRQGILELRQINASEALWICGNLQCPYPVYLEVPTVSRIVPELLPSSGRTTHDQTATKADHSWRNVAAGADQSDQMATAAGSPNQCQNFSDNTVPTHHHRTAHNTSWHHTVATSIGDPATMAMNPELTLMEPGNVLDELSAMFEGT